MTTPTFAIQKTTAPVIKPVKASVAAAAPATVSVSTTTVGPKKDKKKVVIRKPKTTVASAAAAAAVPSSIKTDVAKPPTQVGGGGDDKKEGAKKKTAVVRKAGSKNKTKAKLSSAAAGAAEGGKKRAKKRVSPYEGVVVPSRHQTAWMIFSKDKRKTLTGTGTGAQKLSFGEIGRRLGTTWKALTPAERQKYHDRETADRLRYDGELAKLTDIQKDCMRYQSKLRRRELRKKHAAKVASGCPPRVVSPFMEFVKDRRAQILKANPTVTKFEAIGQLLGHSWNQLATSERKPYIAKSAKAKAAYVDGHARWKALQKAQLEASRAAAKVALEAKKAARLAAAATATKPSSSSAGAIAVRV